MAEIVVSAFRRDVEIPSELIIFRRQAALRYFVTVTFQYASAGSLKRMANSKLRTRFRSGGTARTYVRLLAVWNWRVRRTILMFLD